MWLFGRLFKLDLCLNVEANIKASIGQRSNGLPATSSGPRGLKLGDERGRGRDRLEADTESVSSVSADPKSQLSFDEESV